MNMGWEFCCLHVIGLYLFLWQVYYIIMIRFSYLWQDLGVYFTELVTLTLSIELLLRPYSLDISGYLSRVLLLVPIFLQIHKVFVCMDFSIW